MRSNRFLLVTGATGCFGIEIIRLLLKRPVEQEVGFLIRAGSEESLYHRWQQLLSSVSEGRLRPEDVSHLRPIKGDITRYNLGIDNPLLSQLQDKVTEIIHAAADTRFFIPLNLSRELNVEGTRNLLAFARSCRRVQKIAHISSLFVAGRRSGLILEEELEHDCRFVSTYEQTKYESEILVREGMKTLPISIYRLALLGGRATDGYVHNFGAFHQALRFYCAGLIHILPGLPHSTIDILPTDYAAEVTLMLFNHNFIPGTTYHICAGKYAIAIQDFLELVRDAFMGPKTLRKRRILRLPDIVDMGAYESYLRPILTNGKPALKQMVRVLSALVPHLVLPKIFENQLCNTLVNDSVHRPDIQDYFPKVLNYCVGSNWGRGQGSIKAPLWSERDISK